ncbi:hypothetical protein LJR084_008087 [Variovorax sp. LjRoot84]|uniref:hypothetical protein n=1 Tax=Variovorax sp. LjRoot84 TaxID=3342340 RepID=UPI003ECE5E2C
MKAIAVVGVGTAALLVVAAIFFAGGWSLNEAVVTQDDISMCSAGKFEIESRSARTEGGRIVVTAAVRNKNSIACGVQVSVAMKDKAGKQIAIEQLWVAGVGNIPAGATHSFPVYLSPEVSKQAEGGDYDIRPTNARVWRQQ